MCGCVGQATGLQPRVQPRLQSLQSVLQSAQATTTTTRQSCVKLTSDVDNDLRWLVQRKLDISFFLSLVLMLLDIKWRKHIK